MPRKSTFVLSSDSPFSDLDLSSLLIHDADTGADAGTDVGTSKDRHAKKDVASGAKPSAPKARKQSAILRPYWDDAKDLGLDAWGNVDYLGAPVKAPVKRVVVGEEGSSKDEEMEIDQSDGGDGESEAMDEDGQSISGGGSETSASTSLTAEPTTSVAGEETSPSASSAAEVSSIEPAQPKDVAEAETAQPMDLAEAGKNSASALRMDLSDDENDEEVGHRGPLTEQYEALEDRAKKRKPDDRVASIDLFNVRDLVKEIDREDNSIVHSAWHAGEFDVVFTTASGALNAEVPICGDETQRLAPGNWLKDGVMNAFLHVIVVWHTRWRLQGCKHSPIHAFDSNFSNKLVDSGGYCFKGVKRWGRKAKAVDGDIFKLEMLILVANPDRMHWIVIIVFMKKKIIKVFDSLHASRQLYIELTVKYLDDEAKRLGRNDIDLDAFQKIDSQTSDPEQPNGNDCGVLTLLTTASTVFELPLNFPCDETATNNARSQITLILYNIRQFYELD